MILVFQKEPGSLTIDFAEENNFGDSADAVELRIGLFVLKTDSTSITVDDSSNPSAVVQFVSDFLTERGYLVKIEAELSQALLRLGSEHSLIERIKTAAPRKSTVPSEAQLGLKSKLLPHQIKGLVHALAVENGANFSVPGSGKTRVALAVFAAMKSRGILEHLVVIGPASSFVPWQTEFYGAFGRKPITIKLIGTQKRRAALLAQLAYADLLLCTYQMAYREAANLVNVLAKNKVLLVLDESHHIKNINLGPWARSVLDIAPFASRRMILSGTPAPHSLKDLWSQFTFLWPSQHLMGNRIQYEQFLQSSRSPAKDLNKKLNHFFIRTKRSELGLRKPTYNFSLIPYAAIPKRQRLIIRLLELKTLAEARGIGLNIGDLQTLSAWRKARIIRLLQASSNPELLNSTSFELGNPGGALESDPKLIRLLSEYATVEVPAKISWTLKKVQELAAKGRKVVIWTSWIKNLHLLHRLLKEFSPLLIFGGVPAYEEDVMPGFENRERNIREFLNDNDRMVLLANPAACSESISLHKTCQNAIYLDRTFNCGQFLQSMDRILRVGMPPNTRATYHIPMVQSAIEALVDTRLSERQRSLYAVLDEDMPVLGYEEEWSLFEREDDVNVIFEQLIQEIEKGAREVTHRTARRSRARR